MNELSHFEEGGKLITTVWKFLFFPFSRIYIKKLFSQQLLTALGDHCILFSFICLCREIISSVCSLCLQWPWPIHQHRRWYRKSTEVWKLHQQHWFASVSGIWNTWHNLTNYSFYIIHSDKMESRRPPRNLKIVQLPLLPVKEEIIL